MIRISLFPLSLIAFALMGCGESSITQPEKALSTATPTPTITSSALPVVTDGVTDGHTDKIKDETAPFITLVGPEKLIINVGDEYKEQGAIATNEIDLAGTSKSEFAVTINGTVDINNVGKYTLTYHAEDQAGNKATPVMRQVYVEPLVAPVITLNGAADITLAIGENYLDLGASATDDIDETVEVITTENVNTDQLGRYYVLYSAKDSAGNLSTAIRTVNVIDVDAPIITINGDASINHNIGDVYTELGANVKDNYDSSDNITLLIEDNIDINALGQYQVTYQAVDNAGNSSKVIRTVNVVDLTPPVITLVGEQAINQGLAQEYIELGATVSDNLDSSVPLTISGEVMVDTFGEYTITYTATDIAGNSTSVTRNVTVTRLDTTPPVLAIDAQHYSGQHISVSATATDDSDGAINPERILFISADKTEVRFIATDSSGNSSEALRSITLPSGSRFDVDVNVGDIVDGLAELAVDIILSESEITRIEGISSVIIDSRPGNSTSPMLQNLTGGGTFDNNIAAREDSLIASYQNDENKTIVYLTHLKTNHVPDDNNGINCPSDNNDATITVLSDANITLPGNSDCLSFTAPTNSINYPHDDYFSIGDIQAAGNVILSETSALSIPFFSLTPGFVTLWQTDNIGDGDDKTISFITATKLDYNFVVDWGDGIYEEFQYSDQQERTIKHSYAEKGVYPVTITGVLPHFKAGNGINGKLIDIKQWGDIKWQSMASFCAGCINVKVSASDTPDLSQVTSMENMFSDAKVVNFDVSQWNVASVLNMNSIFARALSFEQALDSWDTGQVKRMENAIIHTKVTPLTEK